MSHQILKLGKCRIIFFDLEFYVPSGCRTENGFCYNPWDAKCRLIGGSFLSANPDKDFKKSHLAINNKIISLWSWNYKTEKRLLENILDLLKSNLDIVQKAHDNKISPVLCGIGITSSDIPILFELFKRFGLLTNEEAFSFQNKFRVVDLSVLSIPIFNNSTYFLYPKSKNIILNKYLENTKFESGKIVWDFFEAKKYFEIENRVKEELFHTYKCYKFLRDDFIEFKALEKIEKKKIKRMEVKDNENNNNDQKNDIATNLFTKVLVRFAPGQKYLLNEILNKMREIDSSFKISNTRFKKMKNIAKEFENNGLIKTQKNKNGQLLVQYIAASE